MEKRNMEPVLCGRYSCWGFDRGTIISKPEPIKVNPALVAELHKYHVDTYSSQLPPEIFSFHGLFTLRGFILLVVGGFFVGFGTRYAGGCTSGHSIMGLSNLQLPSLIATICFMAGGFIMANIFFLISCAYN